MTRYKITYLDYIDAEYDDASAFDIIEERY